MQSTLFWPLLSLGILVSANKIFAKASLKEKQKTSHSFHFDKGKFPSSTLRQHRFPPHSPSAVSREKSGSSSDKASSKIPSSTGTKTLSDVKVQPIKAQAKLTPKKKLILPKIKTLLPKAHSTGHKPLVTKKVSPQTHTPLQAQKQVNSVLCIQNEPLPTRLPLSISSWTHVQRVFEKEAREFAHECLRLIQSQRISSRQKEVIFVISKSIYILRRHFELARALVSKKSKTPQDNAFLAFLRTEHKVSHDGQLLKRLAPIPLSLALSQSHIESGWGQAGKKNAYFGIRKKGGTKTSSYASPDQAIKDYVQTMNEGKYLSRYRAACMRFRVYRTLQSYKDMLETLRIYCCTGNYPKKNLDVIQKYNFFTFDRALENKFKKDATQTPR